MSRLIAIDAESRSMRILGVEHNRRFTEATPMPLRFTPRGAALSEQKMLVVAEADCGEFDQRKRRELLQGQARKDELQRIVGYPRPSGTSWASCVRVVNPRNPDAVCVLPMEPKEAALCVCVCRLHLANYSLGELVVVGTAAELQGHRLSECTRGWLRVFALAETPRPRLSVPARDGPQAPTLFPE